MVNAIALNPIINASGICTGYKLKDETGQVMEVNSEAIIGAIQRGAISISNLVISSGNKLVMKEDKPESNETLTLSQDRREVIQKDVEGSISKIGRMHELVNKLNEARKVYEQGTDEIMTNFEYDKLYDELVELESELGTVLNNSPTINVGYEVVSNLPKEAHNSKMLSLAKTKERADLASFLNTHEGILSWKLDGLTVVLTYDGGTLTKAVTRGNGEIGEVVTNNALTFKNLPRVIPFAGHLVLRGEAIIKYSTFEKINAALGPNEEKYKNPRNLCSGSVRQLDSSITAQRDVNWVCFELVECSDAIPNNVDERFKWLKDLGFSVVNSVLVKASNVNDAIERFAQLVKTNDFPSDGLVLTYRDVAYGKGLGQTAKTPRHSIAFKWQDEEAESSMLGIEWQVGRTGVITPVAEFVPVDIEGSTVSRASLHNLSILTELMAQPFVGQKIKVFKANMIIPQISWAEFQENPSGQLIYIPGNCPCCGEPTAVHEDPNSGVLTLWCENPDCGEKGNQTLKHFVTRDAMNIDGISSATLETLCEAGIITDLVSIYHIKEHQDEICSLEGFGYTSFMNMVNAIEKSRNVKLHNLIYALGIPNVGLATAKLICKHFDNELAETATASYDELISIEGIGDVIAQSFVDYFEDEDNADQFVRLCKELNIIQEQVSTNTSMSGVTICVTGDVYIFPNRRAIKDLVENLGGKLTGSVSKSTSYLVTNDTTSGSNKNKAAQSYGIPILTEQEFIDKFNLSQYI